MVQSFFQALRSVMDIIEAIAVLYSSILATLWLQDKTGVPWTNIAIAFALLVVIAVIVKAIFETLGGPRANH